MDAQEAAGGAGGDGSDAEDDGVKKKPMKKRKTGKKGKGEDAEFGVARGVDFQGVSAVINVDLPPTAATYTHRIGRTARAGASGMCALPDG